MNRKCSICAQLSGITHISAEDWREKTATEEKSRLHGKVNPVSWELWASRRALLSGSTERVMLQIICLEENLQPKNSARKKFCSSVITRSVIHSTPLRLCGLTVIWPRHYWPSHLKWLQKRVEIDENDLRDVVFSGIHKEENVGDAQQRQQNQGCFHSFSVETGTRALSQYHTRNTCIYTDTHTNKHTHKDTHTKPDACPFNCKCPFNF